MFIHFILFIYFFLFPMRGTTNSRGIHSRTLKTINFSNVPNENFLVFYGVLLGSKLLIPVHLLKDIGAPLNFSGGPISFIGEPMNFNSDR